MILNKEVKLKVNGSKIKYYKKLGYNIPYNNVEIIIKVKDLTKGSKVKVNCECDNCHKIINITYNEYLKNIEKYNFCTCFDCCQIKRNKTCLKKYNVENPSQLNEFKEKRKQTIMERYGVEYALQSEEFKEKYKQTCLNKYNVKNYLQSDDKKEKTIKTNINKYGVENAMQNNDIKNKMKQTMLDKYGVEYALQDDKIKEKLKQTCLKKYGVEYLLQSEVIKEKTIKTNINKYGVEYISQSDFFKNKVKKNSLIKYKVESPNQNKEIHLKQQNNSIIKKRYNNTNLYYQGTYEKDFLDNFFNNLDINNGPTIKYNYKNKNKVYFPDFYIKSKNLIVEIKSEYYYKLHLNKNLTKQKACIDQGYDFLFIINKNYSKLNEKIKDK